MTSPSDQKLLKRAYEVVHHDDDCPGRGRGDEHCRCDAVSFLNDLEARFEPAPYPDVRIGLACAAVADAIFPSVFDLDRRSRAALALVGLAKLLSERG